MKKISLLILLISLFGVGNIYAGIPHEDVFGVGLTGDYGYNGNYHDGGIYLSSKVGFVSIISAFVSGDIGYRFNEEMVHGDLGVEAYILFFGLRVDFAYGIKTSDTSFYPGVGYYLNLGLVNPYAIPVLFVGGRTLVDYGTELRVGFTFLYNFL